MLRVKKPSCCQRPYCVECTRSHPNSEVKRRKARPVLGWGTAWEALRVPLAFYFWVSRRFSGECSYFSKAGCCQRPYCVECTRSHPNSEVKRRKARPVLGWGTAWEALRVPLAFYFSAEGTPAVYWGDVCPLRCGACHQRL